MTTGEEKLLLSANEAFYKAFESLDISRMDQVWDSSGAVQCVHPGWDLLTDWETVRESWERIFHHTRYMEFRITPLAVTITEDLAYVVCRETFTSSTGGPAGESAALATNVFRKHEGIWKIIHHHASPLLR